jgi:hypothetical protein
MRQAREQGLVAYMEHCKKHGKEKHLFPTLSNITQGMRKRRR